MSSKWPIFRPPSLLSNSVHRKSLMFLLGVLLIAFFSVAQATNSTRLVNISSRCFVKSGVGNTIAGFIIEGGSKTIIIRALGRGLGLSPNLDVEMDVSKFPSGEFVARNDNWQTDIRADEIPSHLQLPDATDAGLLLTLPAGAYTAVVKPKGASGIGLVSVDDLDDPQSASRLINISTRCSVEKSDKNAIAGFIIQGTGTQKVMIGAFGKGLGLSLNLDTQMELSKYPSGDFLESNESWQRHRNADQIPTHLQLPDPSDAGLLLDLPAGAYTAVVKPTGEIGIGLVAVNAITIPGTEQPVPLYYSLPEPGNTLDLGRRAVGTAMNQDILTIGNKGNADLTVNFVTINSNVSDFKLNSPNFPVTIASGLYEAITMQCRPTEKGLHEGTLQLSTNDPNQSLITYPLKCEGFLEEEETVAFCSTPNITPTERNDDIIGSLGFGYDNQRDIFKPQSCIKGTTTEVGAGSSNLDFTSISDYEEFKRHLGIQVAFNVNATFFKMNAETKFALNHRETELSRSLLFKVDVRLPNEQFDHNGLSEFGQKMYKSGHQCFINACGDQFVFQTERGGSLYIAMKFDFTNSESKKEFFAKLAGGDLYQFAEMNNEIRNASSSVKQSGKVTVSAYQIGGEATQLTNIFGTDNISPFLTCNLVAFDKCQQAMQNAINYAKSNFANSISSKPHLLDYKTVSYKDIGVPMTLQALSSEIIAARKELAYQFEWQYSDLLLTRSWLDDFADQLTPEAKQYLREIEQALDINIEMLSHAGIWCFSDLSSCLDKKREAFENLRDYNKDWLYGIQVVPPVMGDEYLDEKSFTLGYFEVTGCFTGCGKCRSRSGQICLDNNCVVDRTRQSHNNYGDYLQGNDAQPGIGIAVNKISVYKGSFATHSIEGQCLKSVVTICNDPTLFGDDGWYKGTHTLYGKCSRIEKESYLQVPDIP